MSQQKAFTLIELLIVVVVISILAGFISIQVNNSINTGKDTKRKSDIELLGNAIISYSADNYSRLPIDADGCTIGETCSAEINDAFKLALPNLPTDPNSGVKYSYQTPADGSDCTISATLSTGSTYHYNCGTEAASTNLPVTAGCGSSANTPATGYATNIIAWPSSNFCNPGTVSGDPTFPTPGGSTTWTCYGQYLGSNTTCTAYAALDGDCGSASRRYADAETPFGADTICDAGTPNPNPTPPTTKGTSVTWSCDGVNNGINDSCLAEHSANGVCGTANNTNSYTIPSGNPALCNPGNAGTVSFAPNDWTWTCAGLLGGTTSGTCTTHKSIDGLCGTANGKTYAYTVTTYSPDTQCVSNTGTASNTAFPAQGSSVTWTCSGLNGGNPSATCTASRDAAPVVNGVCGTANKTYAYNITTYGTDTFCAPGTPSPTSPAFPNQGETIPWTCAGSGGGTTASCSASRANPPVMCNGVHTTNDCTVAGGTLFNLGSCYICRFGGLYEYYIDDNSKTCPSGWTQYQNWSTTEAREFCGVKDHPPTYGWWITYTAGSHAWSNHAREYMSYSCGGECINWGCWVCTNSPYCGHSCEYSGDGQFNLATASHDCYAWLTEIGCY